MCKRTLRGSFLIQKKGFDKMKKYLLDLNRTMDLQLFADNPEGDNPETGGEGTGGGSQEKTYTQAEIDEIKASWEREQQGRLQQAKNEAMTEAERLASLSEEERVKEQLKKLQEENEQYKTKEQQSALEKEAVKCLEAENLPASLVNIVIGKDAETTKTNIAAFKETYNQAVQQAVEARLAGKTPDLGGKKVTTEKDEIASQFSSALKGGY